MTTAAIRGLAGRALLLCGATVLCALTAAAQTGTVVARAASVTGATFLATPAGAAALTPGSILNPGDRIDTRGGGQVVIDLSDGSMVVVAPGSVVVLKDFRQASSLRELFEITLGMVRVKINHFAGRPNPYRMNSPTASIAVRGTEFSVQVDDQGDTTVIVFEGAVEVSQLSDPGQSTLVQAGRGVLLQGQQFHPIGAPAPPKGGPGDGGDRNNNYDADKDHRNPPPPPPAAVNGPAPPGMPGQAPMAQPAQQAPAPAPAPGGHPDAAPQHNDNDTAQSAGASAYDRYISGLADVAQLPFLLRYNAFADAHLDSLENPAYATQFRSGEARFFLMPSYSGTAGVAERETPVTPGGTIPGDYSISPQFSLFTPIGGNFFVGGSLSASRVGNSSLSGGSTTVSSGAYPGAGSYSINVPASGSMSDYYSGSVVLAARVGRSSFGGEFEKLRGSGTAHTLTGDADGDGPQITGSIQSNSAVSQSRLTAGYSYDISRTTKLGLFYRYSFVNGTDAGTASTFEQYGGGVYGGMYGGASYGGAMPAVDSTLTRGHSTELGMRLRGQFSTRLFYGVTAGWLGLALSDSLVRPGVVDSHQRDGAQRASVGFGLGYLLSKRVLLAWDMSAASTRSEATRFEDATGFPLQNGTADSRFISTQAGVMVDLTKRLFASVSFMDVWHGSRLNVDLFPDQFGSRTLVEDSFFPLNSAVYPIAPRFSDFGAGWRFSRHFILQYLFSTDYGFSGSSHTLMVRYTFGLKKE